MLNERSTQYSDYESIQQENPEASQEPQQPREISNIREALEQVMVIDRADRPLNPQQQQIVVQFVGTLRIDSADAFEQMEPVFERNGVHAYFSEDESPDSDQHVVTVIRGRYDPPPRPWWPNAVLFVLTLFSMLAVGALIQAATDERDINTLTDVRLWEGIPYAFSLLLILGAHELGHYFAARYHKVDVTLPYFIPLPPPISFFGTLGAFIQLREPMKNRDVLFDVGVAGPLAGLVFTIPILLIGLATSDVQVTPNDESIIREGNSILYAASKYVIFGEFLPDEEDNRDVMLNQMAQAGWTGLFVTALNLIPVGQLDGGHVLYTLFGPRARLLRFPILGIFAYLALAVNQAWLLWTVLLFFISAGFARPLEDITPLDRRRRVLGFIMIIIFVLIFIPNPIEFIEASN
jgi:membrane-associated protease RseP (regulator of RpoE activity)